MPTIFRTNNPTRISRIDRSAVALRMTGEGLTRAFFIERFDRHAVPAPGTSLVGCLAKAGQTVQYFELGAVDDIYLGSNKLDELGTDSSVQFRLMFYDAQSGQIIAAIENVRCIDDDGLAPSLISIEPVELGGAIWKLELFPVGSDLQPILSVERELFPFARAATGDHHFMAYVLPEVVRQIATCIAREEIDEDSEGSWITSWQRFFRSLGIAERDGTIDDDQRWIEDCVRVFCKRGQMGPILQSVISQTEEAGK